MTLRIVGAEGGGFEQAGLSVFGVRLTHSNGTTRSFEISEREVQLFSGADGEVLLNGVNVPSGTYSQIRLLARGNDFEEISYVDDALGGVFPLDIPGNRADFQVDFSVSSSSTTVTLVVHTAAALQFIQDDTDHFLLQPAGYAVRHDRSGRIEGTVPNVCGSAQPDDVAVYVYREGADSPTDIQGNTGSVNEPVVSFAADSSLDFLSPRLPEGDWRISYTCQALDDNPDEPDTAVRNELRDNVREITVNRGETTTVNFN
ncbi:MAG: DUF4382 domain-containing protein [Ectothiorhodospiraceae bacterium]|nr:DUF4382 domain-containing protein [Ectothiorhodospiraceae bacterium]